MTPEMWRLVRILRAIPGGLWTEPEIARLRADLVITLHERGLRYSDIAKLLELTPQAISMQIRRWKPRLRA